MAVNYHTPISGNAGTHRHEMFNFPPEGGIDVLDISRHPQFSMQYTAFDVQFLKCPFCGTRQDVQAHGANCLECHGDMLHEHVI